MRIFSDLEAKAKVVASLCGQEFIQFLAAYSYVSYDDLKNRINSSFAFKSSWCNTSIMKILIGKTASATRNGINSSPQTEATTFAFASVLILLWIPFVSPSQTAKVPQKMPA